MMRCLYADKLRKQQHYAFKEDSLYQSAILPDFSASFNLGNHCFVSLFIQTVSTAPPWYKVVLERLAFFSWSKYYPLLWSMKVHCRCYKISQLNPFLSQLNSVHKLTPNFSKIHAIVRSTDSRKIRQCGFYIHSNFLQIPPLTHHYAQDSTDPIVCLSVTSEK
jgi:hypothetical protein